MQGSHGAPEEENASRPQPILTLTRSLDLTRSLATLACELTNLRFQCRIWPCSHLMIMVETVTGNHPPPMLLCHFQQSQNNEQSSPHGQVDQHNCFSSPAFPFCSWHRSAKQRRSQHIQFSSLMFRRTLKVLLTVGLCVSIYPASIVSQSNRCWMKVPENEVSLQRVRVSLSKGITSPAVGHRSPATWKGLGRIWENILQTKNTSISCDVHLTYPTFIRAGC